jgi:serine/threonine protein kinase
MQVTEVAQPTPRGYEIWKQGNAIVKQMTFTPGNCGEEAPNDRAVRLRDRYQGVLELQHATPDLAQHVQPVTKLELDLENQSPTLTVKANFIPGLDLREHFQQQINKINNPEAKAGAVVDIIEAVNSAIGYLLTHKIVHGDVKEGNIVITAGDRKTNNKPKATLIDPEFMSQYNFENGLYHLQAGESWTGTLAYRPQVETSGNTIAISQTQDVYAFALSLLRLMNISLDSKIDTSGFDFSNYSEYMGIYPALNGYSPVPSLAANMAKYNFCKALIDFTIESYFGFDHKHYPAVVSIRQYLNACLSSYRPATLQELKTEIAPAGTKPLASSGMFSGSSAGYPTF